MAVSARQGWLVSYDISNPRRLRRVHRFVVKEAVPVQYSVFYYEGNGAQMGRLMARLGKLIDASADDVRAYALPDPMQLVTLGRGSIPGRAMLFSEASSSLPTLLAPSGK